MEQYKIEFPFSLVLSLGVYNNIFAKKNLAYSPSCSTLESLIVSGICGTHQGMYDLCLICILLYKGLYGVEGNSRK